MSTTDLVEDFLMFCYQHPSLRFWQALREWSGFAFIVGVHEGVIKDIDDGSKECKFVQKFDTYYTKNTK